MRYFAPARKNEANESHKENDGENNGNHCDNLADKAEKQIETDKKRCITSKKRETPQVKRILLVFLRRRQSIRQRVIS